MDKSGHKLRQNNGKRKRATETKRKEKGEEEEEHYKSAFADLSVTSDCT